jgi:protein SCO1/2
MRAGFTILVASLVLASACARSREYELRGQVLAVDAARQEITIKHEDIKGFMPGMTMPFKVRNAKLLEGSAPGDLVTATLVVRDADAYLSAVRVTGKAPLSEPPPVTHAVDVLRPGDSAPDVWFLDESGHPRQFSEWRGRTLAITFIYTRCPLPDFCPRMDRNFAEAQRAIAGDQQLRERAHLLSVSFDPAFDTPAVLGAHARRVGADPAIWNFVTGDRDAIDTFAPRFGVSVIRGDKDTEQIVHNLRTVVIGPNGRLVQIFNGNDWTPAELVAAIRDASDLRR